jgi:hypothetical protein
MDAIRQIRKQQQLLPNGVARDTSCGEVTFGTSQENCMKMQTQNLNIFMRVA